jgi:hypothetical protein
MGAGRLTPEATTRTGAPKGADFKSNFRLAHPTMAAGLGCTQ